MGNPEEAEMPLVAPPSYSEEDIESTSLIVSENTFKMNVVYMVADSSDNVVATNSEFYFNGDMTVDEASDIAIRGYPEHPDTFFQHKAVLFKQVWYKMPVMVGSLDRRMADVFKPKGTMWVTNTSNVFQKLVVSNMKRNRGIFIAYLIFVIVLTTWPTFGQLLVYWVTGK